MALRFAITGQMAVVSASLKTALDLVGSATSRPEIYYATASLNNTGSITDSAYRVAVMRHTTANTGSAVVPVATDSSGVAATATALENCSAEGTYTGASELYDQAIHCRSQMWFYANDARANWIVPATAANGIGIRVLHASATGPYDATINFDGP